MLTIFFLVKKIINMTLILYLHTIIIRESSIKAKNMAITNLGSGNVIPRHGVLLGPHTWAAVGGKSLPRLTVGNSFLLSLLKDFSC